LSERKQENWKRFWFKNWNERDVKDNGGSRFIQADGLKDVVLEVLWLTMKGFMLMLGVFKCQNSV